VLVNGVGNDIIEPEIPMLHPQHPHLNRHYFSNQLITSNDDLHKIKKIKFLLKTHPILFDISRVCSMRYKPTDINTKLCNNIPYISGTFNCGECGKCCSILSFLQMLDPKHDLLKGVNYIEKYMSKYYDYTTLSSYSTGSKYFQMDFNALVALYNTNKLKDIDDYTFVFQNDCVEVIKK
jgi:hypothetical protein